MSKWIPVKEGLPKHGGNYLTTICEPLTTGEKFYDMEVMIAVNRNGMEWMDHNLEYECDWVQKKVIAWMPLLLEPYREESEHSGTLYTKDGDKIADVENITAMQCEVNGSIHYKKLL